jgi:hypothetical protein
MVARAADLVSGTCRLVAGVRRVRLVALSGLLRVPGRLIGTNLLAGLHIASLGTASLLGFGGSRWPLVPTRPAPQHAAQLLSESHRSSPDDDGDWPQPI